jgi:hypothetical protein
MTEPEWQDNPSLKQIRWSQAVFYPHRARAYVKDERGHQAVLEVDGARWSLLHVGFGVVVSRGRLGALAQASAQHTVYKTWRVALGLGLFEMNEDQLMARLSELARADRLKDE